MCPSGINKFEYASRIGSLPILIFFGSAAAMFNAHDAHDVHDLDPSAPRASHLLWVIPLCLRFFSLRSGKRRIKKNEQRRRIFGTWEKHVADRSNRLNSSSLLRVGALEQPLTLQYLLVHPAYPRVEYLHGFLGDRREDILDPLGVTPFKHGA